MDNFITFEEETVDLDERSIYPKEYLEMNVHDLFTKCEFAAGEALFYMSFLHKEFREGNQLVRVMALCEELASIWKGRKFDPNATKCTLLNEDEYRMSLLKWFYRFEDETENLC